MITPIQSTDIKSKKLTPPQLTPKAQDNKFITNLGLPQNYYINFTAKQKKGTNSDEPYYQYDNIAVDIENK
ncbi:hypothetical protein IJZ97_03420, partial [bacterium]|nr:hypothetical protein [bacterium]